MTSLAAPSPLRQRHMLLYASGSLAVALSYQAFATYIQFLYIDVLGLEALAVGSAWAVYGLWNAVNDPLAGYWSDRTRTRWGRRVPWIAAFFLPLSISFYLLWNPPAGVASRGGQNLLLYFLLIILLFDLLWTVVVMNWTSLFPEMFPREKQRAGVSAWRQVFSLLGLLVGVALPPILAGEDWSGRGFMAAVLAVVTALFFGLSLLGSRERPARDETHLSLPEALRAALGNRNFRYFLIANLLIQFVFLALTSTIPFYTKYVLRIQSAFVVPSVGLTLDVGAQNSLFLGLVFIVALPAMPVWTALARRWGAWRTLRLACVLAAVVLLLFFLPNGFLSGLTVALFFGLILAGLLMLTDLLIAAVADEDQLQTGKRREGIFFGLNGLVIRLAFTIQGAITGVVLTLTRYVAPTPGTLYPVQPPSALLGIRLMLAGFPALALLAAAFLLRGYTLHGSRLARVQREVRAMQAKNGQSI